MIVYSSWAWGCMYHPAAPSGKERAFLLTSALLSSFFFFFTYREVLNRKIHSFSFPGLGSYVSWLLLYFSGSLNKIVLSPDVDQLFLTVNEFLTYLKTRSHFIKGIRDYSKHLMAPRLGQQHRRSWQNECESGRKGRHTAK